MISMLKSVVTNHLVAKIYIELGLVLSNELVLGYPYVTFVLLAATCWF